DTLLLLLKSLPLGCYFNIYEFGSHYESFFLESVEYTQTTMQTALKKVKSMKADMGGTEILPPLQNIYSKPCLPSHPRQVMQSLQFALQPVGRDIAIKWNIPAGITVNPVSPPVNMLFNLQRVIQYFQLTDQ
ncbi:hypothetical protein Z043_123856, partial [Scleropages formosus]